MVVEQTTLAYVAGMIDGDGFISITRSEHRGALYFAPQIGIAGTRREPHDLASRLWGGKVSTYVPKNPRHRPQFQWSRVGSAAAEIIQLLRPHLLIKRVQAELSLELFFLVATAKVEDPFPWFGPGYDWMQEATLMRQEMIDLNQSRNRCRKTGD